MTQVFPSADLVNTWHGVGRAVPALLAVCKRKGRGGIMRFANRREPGPFVSRANLICSVIQGTYPSRPARQVAALSCANGRPSPSRPRYSPVRWTVYRSSPCFSFRTVDNGSPLVRLASGLCQFVGRRRPALPAEDRLRKSTAALRGNRGGCRGILVFVSQCS